ncbi:G-protein coupled receptor Mth2-like isoform X9 [Diorhabda carinulata]|uniref:G-protein coupled receptor Mth2-like isoform X9 n=1 Tax=Diorhabda carinulata TaxID=1163345 RepID=UPI0025A02105|nr:G-protein coupled receptor Mth2-like isoform X9 [Diorhabda carinulata]
MYGMVFEPEDYDVVNDTTRGCVCHMKICVQKCCGNDQHLNGRECVNSKTFTNFQYYNFTNPVRSPENLWYIYGNPCRNDKFGLVPRGEYYLQSNGSLYAVDEVDWSYKMYSPLNYCVDYDFLQGFKLKAVICEFDIEEKSNILPTVGMIISMPFLLATFLVYLILPERNLHRKALMSYVFTLLAAYITLVTIQMYPYQFKPVPCQILGYCIIFFFLVSFFWMNVMCIDMWLAFSGMRTVMSKKYAERKRFIIYCIYAWGTPIIHVGIVLLLNTHSPPDADYYPKIGDPRCFLGDGMPTFYYFYLPMAIIIGINIVFFILTTVRIQQIKKETSMLKQTESKKSYEDDKQKFNLYLKLMFAMGINWIMELISWTVEKLLRDTPTFIWYLSDFTNAMYGVLIFVIFVFKKKIWQSLKKRYYVFIGKPHLAHSFTTSSARGTRASNYSTTDTAVSTDYRLNDMKRIPEESALNRT